MFEPKEEWQSKNQLDRFQDSAKCKPCEQTTFLYALEDEQTENKNVCCNQLFECGVAFCVDEV